MYSLYKKIFLIYIIYCQAGYCPFVIRNSFISGSKIKFRSPFRCSLNFSLEIAFISSSVRTLYRAGRNIILFSNSSIIVDPKRVFTRLACRILYLVVSSISFKCIISFVLHKLNLFKTLNAADIFLTELYTLRLKLKLI